MKQLSQEFDITGVIMPNNWDENGKIIDVAIYTDTEEVYGVEHNNLTQKLLNLMHQQVEVKGNIRERPDGNKSIVVKKYIVREEIVGNERRYNERKKP